MIILEKSSYKKFLNLQVLYMYLWTDDVLLDTTWSRRIWVDLGVVVVDATGFTQQSEDIWGTGAQGFIYFIYLQLMCDILGYYSFSIDCR